MICRNFLCMQPSEWKYPGHKSRVVVVMAKDGRRRINLVELEPGGYSNVQGATEASILALARDHCRDTGTLSIPYSGQSRSSRYSNAVQDTI